MSVVANLKIFQLQRHEQNVDGASYIYTSLFQKFDATQVDQFIEALKDSGNSNAYNILVSLKGMSLNYFTCYCGTDTERGYSVVSWHEFSKFQSKVTLLTMIERNIEECL